jgi:cytochrome c
VRIVVVVLVLAAAACRGGPAPRPPGAALGDPTAGAQAIEAYGCGSCHAIPGVEGADSLVGPPLHGWSHRSFIAGTLPNDLANLVAWIRAPDRIEPDTAMPDLGVSDADARDIAAYLLTLD